MLTRDKVEKGMLVRYAAMNAFDAEIESANHILKKNQSYTISDIFKDKWGCYLYLEGILRKSFKCEMFEDAGIYVPEEEPKKVAKPRKK